MENEFKAQDKPLILALKKDDPLAFEQLFHKYSQPVYAFVLSVLKSEYEAEEAVQRVFYKVWNKRKDLDESLSFKAYLFTIALNITKKYYRDKLREQKYKQDLAIELNFNSTSDLSVVEFQNLLDYLDTIIEKLPSSRKQIFLLSKKEGLSNSEIAEKLNLSVQTVKNQLVSARSFLLSEAGKDGNEHLHFLYFIIIGKFF